MENEWEDSYHEFSDYQQKQQPIKIVALRFIKIAHLKESLPPPFEWQAVDKIDNFQEYFPLP